MSDIVIDSGATAPTGFSPVGSSAGSSPASTLGNSPDSGPIPGDGTWRDYVALLKPRVMSLVVFSGIAGLIAAPGSIHPVLAVTAILCIAVGAGAAGCINMWFDRDIDAVMSRTQRRPIVTGKISPDDALAFGVILTVASILLLGLSVNWFAAAILAFASGFYVFVYTMWLKRRTPQNIVIGGAAGAFPPMIGWAAVTGDATVVPLLLFAIIFLWTPPHFWALSLYRSSDYRRAGIPMLPVVAGESATRRQILGYTVALAPVAVAPWLLGATGPIYGVGAAALSLVFIRYALAVFLENGATTNHKAARRMFGYSIIYLFGVFGLLIADNIIWMRGLV
ncbi:heme o synthase [Fodinicurvata sp. EGI_FJ10296]|uniref:heme o synthase n=1 Tax=Fodinicurvata sp. EGI_FJ10296 TaxID=3231908 RepID=UPI003456B177